MSDSSKLSEASEDRLRVQPVYGWWIPILWGMGIGVSLGLIVIAVIVIDRKGLLPSWVFGWISSDRETQKPQFVRVLYGLCVLWVTIRLAKMGLFGEDASTAYNVMVSKLEISQAQLDKEVHRRFCAVRNVRIALF